MSKTGAWVLDMQEDAANLTKEEFIKKHGEHNLDLWTEVHEELGDLEEMQSKLKKMQKKFDDVVSRMNKAIAGKILKND
jgi:predicted nuclease with TOPRIM domain